MAKKLRLWPSVNLSEDRNRDPSSTWPAQRDPALIAIVFRAFLLGCVLIAIIPGHKPEPSCVISCGRLCGARSTAPLRLCAADTFHAQGTLMDPALLCVEDGKKKVYATLQVVLRTQESDYVTFPHNSGRGGKVGISL
jgi:hypothetical protein